MFKLKRFVIQWEILAPFEADGKNTFRESGEEMFVVLKKQQRNILPLIKQQVSNMTVYEHFTE